jgi:hypothetical protein
MFLNHLKNFFTKKIVKKTISNVEIKSLNDKIKSVGILFDESYFNEREALVQEFIANGILAEDIRILVFKDTIKKKEYFDYPTFSHKDLSWTATFEKSEVKDFMAQKFDLLINYYDVEKSALLLVSNGSKANFKVGFSSVDKKLNHFMINTNAENYKVFVEELFKYLKILNKI